MTKSTRATTECAKTLDWWFNMPKKEKQHYAAMDRLCCAILDLRAAVQIDAGESVLEELRQAVTAAKQGLSFADIVSVERQAGKPDADRIEYIRDVYMTPVL